MDELTRHNLIYIIHAHTYLRNIINHEMCSRVKWSSSDARREREIRTTGGGTDLHSPIERETQTTGEGGG